MRQLNVYPTSYLTEQENQAQTAGEAAIFYEEFIRNIIKDVIDSKNIIGNFKRDIIISRIFHSLQEKNQFKFFSEYRPGYVRRISEVIMELKLQGITPDIADKILKDSPRLKDLALIYRTYQDFLAENLLCDLEDCQIISADYAGKAKYIEQFDKICFRVFYRLYPIQKKVLEVIVDKGVIVNLPLEHKMKHVNAIKAQNKRIEIEYISKMILRDLEEGIPPQKICIVLPKPKAYKYLLKDAAKEANLSLNFDIKAPLIQNPFVKAFLRLVKEETTDYFVQILLKTNISRHKINKWAEISKSFLADNGYPNRFYNIHSDDPDFAKRDIKAFQALIQLLDELEDIGEMAGEEYTDFEGFINFFAPYLRNYSYNCFDSDKEGIRILSLEQIIGLKFEKIYAAGMIEGDFPAELRSDWLIKEDERKRLNEIGYSFDTIDSHLEDEQRCLKFLLASSSTGCFSYPAVLEDNSSSLMSSYIEDILYDLKAEVKDVRLEDMYTSTGFENFSETLGTISENTRKILGKRFHEEPFSAASLNMYGECPYKFFLARVTGLAAPDEEGEYKAVSRGSAIHKILEIFFKNHKDTLESIKLEEYENEIIFLTESVMENSGVKESFPHPLLFEIEKNEIAKSITNYVGWYVASRGDFKPILFELGFGSKKNFSLDFAPDILLSGKIDRIDEDAQHRLLIIDYKSGSTPDIKEMEDGTNLQMPIYILAAEHILKKPVVGGAFVSVKKGAIDNFIVRDRDLPFISKRQKKGILTQEEWETVMEKTKDTVRAYVNNIREGKFPIEPKKCPKIQSYGSFCDFTQICPWEEF